MTPEINNDSALMVERTLPAPIDEVYAAWTDPKFMGTWLSPTGTAEVEADVRVGGALRVVMIGDDTRIEHTGEYLVVEPPHRLIFTWISPHTGSQPSIVTVVLTAQGDETHLRLSHERLPQETARSHEGGWGQILDRLAAAMAIGAHRHGS